MNEVDEAAAPRTVIGMKPLRHRAHRTAAARRAAARHGSVRRSRGATMIEFAFILPIFMFMLLFIIDMGTMILMQGAMQDATYSAARTGAQYGGAAVGTTCQNGASDCQTGYTRIALNDAAGQIPGYPRLGHIVSMGITSGAKCTSGTANGTNNVNGFVSIKVTYTTRMVTPGLAGMLRMLGSNSGTGNEWTSTAVGVARCQIVVS